MLANTQTLAPLSLTYLHTHTQKDDTRSTIKARDTNTCMRGPPQGAAEGAGRSKLQQSSKHCKHTSFLSPSLPSPAA